jgi:hypothetical protein
MEIPTTLACYRGKFAWRECGQRQKLSRAARSVNRECGTANVIGVGSGELLGSAFTI